jgi:hypothetical protein
LVLDFEGVEFTNGTVVVKWHRPSLPNEHAADLWRC